MDKPRPCGCKGRRTCILCEKEYNISPENAHLNLENGSYMYCPWCKKAWPGWDLNEYKRHPDHTGNPLHFPGIFIELDFLSKTEELELASSLDNLPWDSSQSGRRKQNFGPKCNFKKRKLRLGDFKGFPETTKFVQEKFEKIPIMKGFQTIEQCSLEYTPERGASIDPHIDDCWIWGERIVTVNLLSDSVLTMSYNDKPTRYNLDCVETYPAVLDGHGELSDSNEPFKVRPLNGQISFPIVRIPMPCRSLLVMYGSARYNWEHRILREDVKIRRVCLAYREFTPPYLKDDKSKHVLLEAKNFW
ncbi:unnamed protein product [Acanthoscelides obtectus]|uniref:Uncharacterized protein n=1 Tax=Acanthoscelides obtectus TaxID=200917 RepID=A0A9P0MCV7_ACAOB|nr:unnamed protein product [Acanthoscelides obtectus]CAK1634562.1 Alpha-ketoglutarate-dependent dioxygenase alkB homolog 4 [Acanthoscelides obtectus]